MLLRSCACALLALTGLLPARAQTVSYVPDTTDFLNPERGFYENINVIAATDLGWVRDAGFSLVHSYVRLDAYRDAPLPAAYLDSLGAGLDAVRDAGLKVILRFTYNFGEGEPDAPLERILEHIVQLQPLLGGHADVIAVLQAGFIGEWGEWHTSTNGLDQPGPKALVHQALLAALPPERAVQLRYLRDLRRFFPEPLPPGEAFTTTDRARTAHHNDCFLANAHDAGTYCPP